MEQSNDVEYLIREQIARTRVLEILCQQLIVKVSKIFDEPETFVRIVMVGAEDTIVAQCDNTNEEEKQIAEKAFELLNSFSLELATLVAKSKHEI